MKEFINLRQIWKKWNPIWKEKLKFMRRNWEKRIY